MLLIITDKVVFKIEIVLQFNKTYSLLKDFRRYEINSPHCFIICGKNISNIYEN